MTFNWHKKNSKMIEMFCILIVMMITRVCTWSNSSNCVFQISAFHFMQLCINQLSLKMWLEKFIGAVSKGLDGENTPSSILETPRGKETLPVL